MDAKAIDKQDTNAKNEQNPTAKTPLSDAVTSVMVTTTSADNLLTYQAQVDAQNMTENFQVLEYSNKDGNESYSLNQVDAKFSGFEQNKEIKEGAIELRKNLISVSKKFLDAVPETIKLAPVQTMANVDAFVNGNLHAREAFKERRNRLQVLATRVLPALNKISEAYTSVVEGFLDPNVSKASIKLGIAEVKQIAASVEKLNSDIRKQAKAVDNQASKVGVDNTDVNREITNSTSTLSHFLDSFKEKLEVVSSAVQYYESNQIREISKNVSIVSAGSNIPADLTTESIVMNSYWIDEDEKIKDYNSKPEATENADDAAYELKEEDVEDSSRSLSVINAQKEGASATAYKSKKEKEETKETTLGKLTSSFKDILNSIGEKRIKYISSLKELANYKENEGSKKKVVG